MSTRHSTASRYVATCEPLMAVVLDGGRRNDDHDLKHTISWRRFMYLHRALSGSEGAEDSLPASLTPFLPGSEMM
jgi:hypothetical protein